MIDIGDRVLYVIPGSLKVRPAIVIEIDQEATRATLHVFTLSEDIAFVSERPIVRDVRHAAPSHRLGHTFHLQRES